MAESIQKDKMATMQVLGSLLKKPTLLLDDKYKLNLEDFPERFHQIVYGAIDNLVKNSVQSFTFVTIDDFLSKYEKQYKVFSINRGNEYIQNIMMLAEPDNFNYYYSVLKKFSLLRSLESRGFDTKKIYNTNEVLPDKIVKMQEDFDSMSLDDIVIVYEKEINEIKQVFDAGNGDGQGIQAGEGLKLLKEELKKTPEFGVNLASKKMTTICRGARLKKLYMRSAPSGQFKTRMAVADALAISIPETYNIETSQWETTTCCEPTLFITTELELSEIQTMVLAYVANVDEEAILDGKYTGEEEARIDKAIEIVERSFFFIEYIPSFDIEILEHIIKKHKYAHNVGYVFFDYLFASAKILTEMANKAKGTKMREDNILLLAIDRLKFLANTLNIFIFTATQVNDSYKQVKSADQGVLRGAKSLADKVDIGYAMLPVTESDLEMITPIVHALDCPMPSTCIHVYKARRSKLAKVKLWIYFNGGTLRWTDCFVTNNDYELLDVDDTNIEIILEENAIDPDDITDDITASDEPSEEDHNSDEENQQETKKGELTDDDWY